MIGRGLIANPGLVREVQTGEVMSWEERLQYAAALQQAYQEIMPETPVLFKMKEVWSYMAASHPDSAKLWKKIKKTRRLSEYESVIRTLR